MSDAARTTAEAGDPDDVAAVLPDPSESRSTPWERRGWYGYDWANSAFATTVSAVFLGPYLTALAEDAADAGGKIHPLGLTISAESFFPFLISASVLPTVVLLPILGAVADRTQNKKPILAFFAYLGAVATMCLYFVTGSTVDLGLAQPPAYLVGAVLYFVANLSLGASSVINNSFLPEIAGPDERDTVSSRGWASGYFAGFLVLGANLWLFSNHEALGVTEGHAVRISMFSAGVWWAVFTLLPLLLLRRHRPVLSVERGSVLSAGFRQLARTLRRARTYPRTLAFLLAYLIYNDGIAAVIALSAVYAVQELELGIAVVTQAILMVQFLGFLGALLFGQLARRFGAKRVILASLVIWTVAITAAFFQSVGSQTQFYGLAAVIGLVFGGSQALSRSLFSHTIPTGEEAEYFGLYEVTERGTSWIAPLVFGLALNYTGSYRIAIISIVAFFVVGFVLLYRVDMRRAIIEAGHTPPTRL